MYRFPIPAVTNDHEPTGFLASGRQSPKELSLGLCPNVGDSARVLGTVGENFSYTSSASEELLS